MFGWIAKLFGGGKPAMPTLHERFEAVKKHLTALGIANFQSMLMDDSGLIKFGISIDDATTKERLDLGFLVTVHQQSLQMRCYGIGKLPAGASPSALLREANRINRASVVKIVWNEEDGDIEIHMDLMLGTVTPSKDQIGLALAGPFAVLQQERAKLLEAIGAGGGGGGGGGGIDSL